jgi:two-component system, sensor histidine kinase PdtaS
LKLHGVRAPVAALGLATALFLVIAGIAGQSVWQGYGDAISRGEQRALTAAQTVAAHFQWMVEASRQALRRIDDTVGFRPELLSSTRLGDIDDAIDGLPDSVDVRIFDAEGRELYSTQPEAGELEISDREYFVALRGGESVVVSSLLVDRVTKKQSFVIARRLVRGGVFSGIAAIVVPTDLIATFWSSLNLGSDSATSIIREDGWLVTRFPQLDSAVNVGDQIMFTIYLPNSDFGAFQAPSRVDGSHRIIGYQRVPGAPLIAAAALSRSTALADFKARSKRLIYSLIPVVIGLFGFSWWVSHLLIADVRQRESLMRALEQNRLLFREIHHRVKNNLQTVASLVRLQSLPQEAKRDLANRIAAMAAVHEQIYRSDFQGDVDLDGYLRNIVADIELAFDRPVEVSYEMERATISADKASVVGLVVTEVVSNSLKHGFPGNRTGNIVIRLSHSSAGRIRLEINDNGAGFDTTTLTEGLGLKLIRGFALQLNGEYTLNGENGLAFALEFSSDSDEIKTPFPAG